MIDPTNFIYVSIFILPVVVFSISLFIDREEGTLLPFHLFTAEIGRSSSFPRFCPRWP
ncbi:MAG: hypothetical protein MZU97_11040 [Bacillus subtilis]|nr:hypothetical protein [Bacillus subtilis]